MGHSYGHSSEFSTAFSSEKIATALAYLLDSINRSQKHEPLRPLTLTLISCHTSVWAGSLALSKSQFGGRGGLVDSHIFGHFSRFAGPGVHPDPVRPRFCHRSRLGRRSLSGKASPHCSAAASRWGRNFHFLRPKHGHRRRSRPVPFQPTCRSFPEDFFNHLRPGIAGLPARSLR